MGMIVPQSLLDLYANWWIAALGIGVGIAMGVIGAMFIIFPAIAGWRVLKAAKKAFWIEMALIAFLAVMLLLQANVENWRKWSEKVHAKEAAANTEEFRWPWSAGGGK